MNMSVRMIIAARRLASRHPPTGREVICGHSTRYAPFASAVVAIILVSVSRWMLAVPLSAVFKMAGAGATDESSALLRGRRWRSLLFLVVSGLVSCNFAAPLRCIGLCDVLNIAHPFTEWPASGKLAWGALISATGTLADIAVLFGFVALVVYARRLKEPLAADARLPRRLAVLLVATGLALAVAVPTLAFMRSPGGFQNVDEARVFRMANMSEDEASSISARAIRSVPRCRRSASGS